MLQWIIFGTGAVPLLMAWICRHGMSGILKITFALHLYPARCSLTKVGSVSFEQMYEDPRTQVFSDLQIVSLLNIKWSNNNLYTAAFCSKTIFQLLTLHRSVCIKFTLCSKTFTSLRQVKFVLTFLVNYSLSRCEDFLSGRYLPTFRKKCAAFVLIAIEQILSDQTALRHAPEDINHHNHRREILLFSSLVL